MGTVDIKRVYEDASDDDGYRVLVDRLWPRGIKKESAHVDEWLKEVGPSNELRKKFGHDPDKYPDFAAEYRQELEDSEAFAALKTIVADHPHVTLVYSAKDTEHNQATVLQGLLS